MPTVVVEGSRLSVDQQVRNFVDVVTRRLDKESPARWHQRVCPLVAGLTRIQGEFVLQRISEVATIAGAPLGARNCRANLYVLFVTDPAEVLRAWRHRNPRLFGEATPPQIERFIESDRPVRAHYNTRRIGAEGIPLASSTGTGLAGGMDNKLRNVGRMPNSRLERGSVLTLDSVIIVVDASRIQGRKLGPVGDYVAMIGLAELRSDGDYTAAPTILNLFMSLPEGNVPGELSAWDKSLLTSMYAAEQKSTTYQAQVAQRMLTEISLRSASGGQ